MSKGKTTKVFFKELGIEAEVEVSALIEARKADRRGYATFPATDIDGNELAIPGVNGNPVAVALLLNDSTVKSKGSKKAERTMLGA